MKLTDKQKQDILDRHVVFDIETQGLLPFENQQVTCICAIDDSDKKFRQHAIKGDLDSEVKLISKFLVWLCNRNDKWLVSKNGKAFDIDFLLSRLLYHHVMKPGLFVAEELKNLVENTMSMKHFDLQEITKKRVSLDDMATLFGIKNKSADGLKAIKMFEEERYSDLMKYCMRDVKITLKIMDKYLLI